MGLGGTPDQANIGIYRRNVILKDTKLCAMLEAMHDGVNARQSNALSVSAAI